MAIYNSISFIGIKPPSPPLLTPKSFNNSKKIKKVKIGGLKIPVAGLDSWKAMIFGVLALLLLDFCFIIKI